MRLIFLLIFSIFFFAACAPTLTPSDSGVDGAVTIGPMCPVVQVGNPCPNKPYQAEISVLSSSGRTEVLQLRTNADGLFHQVLAPGVYILHPLSPGAMPHSADIPFVVQPHSFTHVEVIYDSGIR